MMTTAAATLADFWSLIPSPPRLRFEKLRSVVREQRGPGGTARFDVVLVETPAERIRLVCAIRDSAEPGDVPRIKDQLREVLDSITRQEAEDARPSAPLYLAIAVRSATARLMEVCAREGISVLDLAGNLQISAGPVFVAVEGRGPRPKPSRRIFQGKACRVVRVVTCWDAPNFTIRELAAESSASFGLTQSVLTVLEAEGFVHRETPKSGYRLRDRAGLLRKWIAEQEPTAIVTKPFFAPSIRQDVLKRAFEVAWRPELPCAFTLAAGLLPNELHISGLPLGLFTAGHLEPLMRTLELRDTTPHNFLIMIPNPVHDTRAGGVFYKLRDLPYGQGVCLPQLAADCALQGGRAKEQAARIVSQLANRDEDARQ